MTAKTGFKIFQRKVSKYFVLVVVLVTFVSRPLLSLGIMSTGIGGGTAYRNGGPSRHMVRNLIRQLEAQAQVNDEKNAPPPVGPLELLNPRWQSSLEIKLCDRFFPRVSMQAYPSGDSVSLRI